jgi:hypothetical protein
VARSNYLLTLGDMFVSRNRPRTLHDIDRYLDPTRIKAMIASDDCFVTIASEIDKISESITRNTPGHVQTELDNITSLLLYLQQHYKVIHKSK